MSETTPTRLSPGGIAPPLRLPAIDGGTFDVASLTGRRYLLAFFRFASCPFCNLRVHELVHRFGELRPGFAVVAVFDSPLDNLQRHAERHAAPFPILADETGEAYRAYAIEHSLGGMLKGMTFRMPTLLRAMASGLRRRQLNITLDPVPVDAVLTLWWGDRMIKRIEPSSRTLSIPLDPSLVPPRPPFPRPPFHLTRLEVCYAAPGHRFASTFPRLRR